MTERCESFYNYGNSLTDKAVIEIWKRTRKARKEALQKMKQSLTNQKRGEIGEKS